MQTVGQWKQNKNINSGISPVDNSGLQSVAQWQVSNPQIQQTNVAPIQTPKSDTSFFGKVVGGAKIVINDVKNVITAPIKTTPYSPEKYLKDVQGFGSDIINSWTNAGNKLVEITKNTSNGKQKSALTRAIDVGEAGLSVLNAFFTPISSVLKRTEKVQGVVGVTAGAVNKLFGSIGVVGADTLEGGVQALPFISQETKNKITPIMRELGALGAQVVAGKVGGDIYTKMAEKSKSIVDTVSKDSTIKQANKDIQTTPPETTPVSTKPIIEVKPQSVSEWKAQGKPDNVITNQVTKPQDVSKQQDITLKPTESTSGLAKSIKTKAIRDKMIYAFDKRFSDLPKLEKRIKTEDMAKATEYTLNNPNEAFKVAMGEKRPPDGMLSSDILVAVTDYARATKNIDVTVKLANESLLLNQSRYMGQEIQALSQLNPISSKLRKITLSRRAKVLNYDKNIKNVTNTIKGETLKNNLSKEDLSWSKFINDITC